MMKRGTGWKQGIVVWKKPKSRAAAAEQRADEEAQARTQAEPRADVAEKRADEEARARQQLEAELRRLRGDTNNE